MTSESNCRLLLLAILLATTVTASAQELTVTQLLQNPPQFDGRRVTVSGYYYSDWEGHGIFADRKTAEKFESNRGIWVSVDPNLESRVRKARVIGVFFYSRTHRPKEIFSGFGPPWGMFSSALVNCTVHLQREATPAPNHTIRERLTVVRPVFSRD